MSNGPLADRMRPTTLDEILGQQRWLGDTGPIRRMVVEENIRSIVLWGPPGCGKTTIARALAGQTSLLFIQISAVLDGVKELRKVIERAQIARRMEDRGTLLFVDEIHRWNKAQQDALLPHVESGTLILVGATTENPGFQLNAALRSRVQIVRLAPLAYEEILAVLHRALNTDAALAVLNLQLAEGALEFIARVSAGDARRALSDLERCVDSLGADQSLTIGHMEATLDRLDIRHDRDGEDHYNVMSALIKSMRGSDPDASVYWLARLLVGGEDPISIARRLLIFASEDVGNADPRGLQVAMDAANACRMTGMPEARIILSQAVTWLATCPKSNAAYLAINRAMKDVKNQGALPVPLHLRNAPTRHQQQEGYGVGYAYPHDHPNAIVTQQYLPEELIGRHYYLPTAYGAEKLIADRMAWWRRKLDQDS